MINKRLRHRYFVPARYSRHREACLALYRALLRLAPRISLPDDLATGWGRNRHPIAIQVQRAFRRNVADTSPRIVYPALSAGYRMLSVLHTASTTPESTQHSEVLTFLSARLAERQRSLANRPPPPTGPKPGAPRPNTLPLLVKVPITPASGKATAIAHAYITPHRPRPASELGGTGRRKIPHIELAGEFPFLRIKKPQPEILSRVLRQKNDRSAVRMALIAVLREELHPQAQEEDWWEDTLARQASVENVAWRRELGEAPTRIKRDLVNAIWQQRTDIGGSGLSQKYGWGSYLDGVNVGIRDMNRGFAREREDLVARADALRQVVLKETRMAEEEKMQRAMDKRAGWEERMLKMHGEGWKRLFPYYADEVKDEVKGEVKGEARPVVRRMKQ
ncbi:hypothetical protein F4808DRAFT_442551 [Astrocystis sublimbata]|nr:hypothetical protein F4808DRAFT_442551 [Astrocystis sublimbata]